MRLLFVVQRYGREVAGGAERACREFATRLSQRGHEVEVLTSCAVNYVDWANEYEPGVTHLNGVKVHRLPVTYPRRNDLFGPLNLRVAGGSKPIPIYLQQEWMRFQGPLIPQVREWLKENATSYEVVIFFTYLYYTTWAGLPAAAGRAPTILHPTAHREPPIYLQIYSLMFRLPNALAFLSEEEETFVRRRFRTRVPSRQIGVGIETEVDGHEGEFRGQFGVGDRPYVLFVGRVDPTKGSEELVDFFAAYKKRNPGPLALVVLGETVKQPVSHPDVVVTGFVDERTKQSAIAGSVTLVHPSYFESFSMVLGEAWAHRKPVLVQGFCEVLVGQVRRAGGGIPYRGFAEFEVALDALLEDQALARSFGEAGRRYIEERYEWSRVMDRYESLLKFVSSRALTP